MSIWRVVLLAILGLASLAAAPVAAGRIACMHRGGDALPADAFPLRAADVARFQQHLDEHGWIRLDPAGDYRRATGIVIRSGQGIFGAAGARMGRLIVAPGTTGAIVSGVIPDALEFPPSRLRTHDNCFERFAARTTSQQPLTLRNAVVENNLFLDVGRIVIDTSTGGRVANNRFIRTLVHGEWPALFVEGRDKGSQDRNVFLWMNVLGATGDGIVLRRQAELNLIAFDAENWNQHGLGRQSAMLSASQIGTLRTFMPHGGDPKKDPGAFLDIQADRFELTATRLIRAREPAIMLRGVRDFVDLLSTGATYNDDAVGANRLIASRSGSRDVRSSGDVAVRARSDLPVAPWEPPEFGEIPEPAGKAWREVRRSAQDSRAQLQGLIDRDGIAVVAAGVYHIGAPLRLRSGQGIIGAGSGRTVIVAMSDDIDIIVGADKYNDKRSTRFVLMDVTLQGGRAAIRHDASGAGSGAQFNLVHLSHVVLRNMTEAGIVLDGIYGWDNNLIDHVTFYGMPVGVRQIPNTLYAGPQKDGDVAGMNYMDKNVFYHCRFEKVAKGMELLAKRANGLNACIGCRFAHYSESALELHNSLSTIVANSDFVGSGSGPVIRSNQILGIVSSRFHAIRPDTVVFDADVACEGCRIQAAGDSSPVIATPGRQLSLVNSLLGAAMLPGSAFAVLLDTVASNATPEGRVRFWKAGRWVIVSEKTPEPVPSLLVDWGRP